jgi:GxxExxY protein
MEPIPDDIEELVTKIINAAYEVHLYLGNNLLESAYEACLVLALQDLGLTVETQKLMPIMFHGHIIPNAYRLDILVNKTIIIEIKVVDEILAVHVQQLLTYLRFSELRMGLIINYKEKHFGKAVRRVVR